MNRTLVLLATTALAASGALAACSSDGTGTIAATSAPGTASSPGVSAPATAGTTGARPTTTTPAKPTTSAKPATLPKTFTDVKKTIKDPDLGQSVTVNKIARNLPWPAGYSASSDAYELVGVEMTWTPSTDYTMPIRQQDFAITSGTATKNKQDTLIDPTLKAAGWTLLPAEVSTGNAVTGWMVFRVDPKAAKTLGLEYTRPPVSAGGGDDFPVKTFSVPLTG